MLSSVMSIYAFPALIALAMKIVSLFFMGRSAKNSKYFYDFIIEFDVRFALVIVCWLVEMHIKNPQNFSNLLSRERFGLNQAIAK